MTGLRLKLECRPPLSLNAQNKWHWSKRGKYAKTWQEEVWVAKCQADQIGPVPFQCPVNIAFQAHYFGSVLIKDEDNWHGAYKPVIDALVKNDILIDDTMKHIVQKSLMQMSGAKKPGYLDIVISPA